MKKLLFFCIIIFSSCKNIKKDYHISSKEKYLNEYRVLKIDSINSFYLIYLENKNGKFKIVSRKESKNICNIIEVNKSYDFIIESIFNKKIKIDNKDVSIMGDKIECMYFDIETMICIEEDIGIYDLYEIKNLKGLCW